MYRNSYKVLHQLFHDGSDKQMDRLFREWLYRTDRDLYQLFHDGTDRNMYRVLRENPLTQLLVRF